MNEKCLVHSGHGVEKEQEGRKMDKSQASFFLLENLATNREDVVNAIASKASIRLKMEKSKAMALLLDRIVAQQKVLLANIFKKVGTARSHKAKIIPILALTVFMVSHSQGFCADADKAAGLDSVTKSVMDIVFGAGIKKSILVLAAAWGLFQAVSSGSFKPLLLWGGIGLAIAYVPKLIEIIANVG